MRGRCNRYVDAFGAWHGRRLRFSMAGAREGGPARTARHGSDRHLTARDDRGASCGSVCRAECITTSRRASLSSGARRNSPIARLRLRHASPPRGRGFCELGYRQPRHSASSERSISSKGTPSRRPRRMNSAISAFCIVNFAPGFDHHLSTGRVPGPAAAAPIVLLPDGQGSPACLPAPPIRSNA